MGILSGKDVFNSKYHTAVIINKDRRSFFVPIKHIIGNNFVAEIEGMLYCFELDGSRLITYRHTMAKTFHWYVYSTSHYKPIDPEKVKELEIILHANSLPKVDNMLYNLIAILGKKEKNLKPGEPFAGHKLDDVINDIQQHKDENPELARNLITFIRQIGTTDIVTPLKDMSEFLARDFLTPDAAIFGTIVTAAQKAELGRKRVNNQPITGKNNMIKIVAIVVIITLVAGLGYYVYSSGVLSHGISMFPTAPGTSNTVNLADYPTPESLAKAIHDKKVECGMLTNDQRNMVNTLTPKPCP